MKTRATIFLLATAILGVGAGYRFLTSLPTKQPIEPVKATMPEYEAEPIAEPIPIKAPPPPEVSIPIEKPPAATQHAAEKPAKAQSTTTQSQQNAALYWEQQIRNFNRLMKRLEHEQNPAKRKQLIRAIGRFVRVNTIDTLDWAMALVDPEEQRAALEAINKNALSGIGARIEVDQTGLPKITETTILGAIGSSGQVEAGDYISGILNTDGSTTYFNGLPIQKIIGMLRGQPGSEVQLVMQRIPEQGGGIYQFNVPLQRSMLVIQPPLD